MISINVNPAASGAGLNLGKSNEALQKSLARLSSGRRIVNSSDDAGGLAVSMKMAAAQKRTEATAINLRNMVSYLDTQDGAFQVGDKVLSRMSELSALARDVSKNAGDIENYDKEFSNLKLQMQSLATEKFNGVSLFDDSTATGNQFTVPTSEDGSQNTTVTQSGIASDPMMKMMNNGFLTFEINNIKYIAPADSENITSGGGDAFKAYEIPGGVLSPVLVSGSLSKISANEGKLTFQIVGIPNVSDGDTDKGIPPIPSQATSTNLLKLVEITRTSTPDLLVDSLADFLLIKDSDGKTVQNNSLNYSNSDEYAYLSQEALQQLADMRAQNGAEMSRINFAQDLLNINATNLEAANSRIMDVDVASESSQLARFQILQQAGTAMLAQANTSQQSLVKLLQG
jgi:flagellin